jgi:hypothetical protein
VFIAQGLDKDDDWRGELLELVDGKFEAGGGGADYRAGVPPFLETLSGRHPDRAWDAERTNSEAPRTHQVGNHLGVRTIHDRDGQGELSKGALRLRRGRP